MTLAKVKSAVRALDLLELFAREQRALSQKEIITKLRYPQSSTTFLLKSLVESGYLGYDRVERLYLPSPEVFRLGSWLEHYGFDRFFRKNVIDRLLRDLQSRSGETASVASSNDLFVHFHRVLDFDLPPALCIPEGRTLPLTACSHGVTLLSAHSDAQIDRICRLIKVREFTCGRSLDLKTMVSRAADARRQGHYFMRNEIMLGSCSVSMLLPVRIAGRHVAIGIGAAVERLEPKVLEIFQILHEAVHEYRDELLETFGTSPHFHCPVDLAHRTLQG